MKQISRLYRVEDENLHGPYQSPKRWACYYTIGYDYLRHPEPHHEGLHHEGMRGDRSCFQTIQQLKRWFDDSPRWQLHNCGFKISIYEVPTAVVQFGTTQCVAPLAREKFITQISLVNDLEHQEYTNRDIPDGGKRIIYEAKPQFKFVAEDIAL